jgi:hypothetical protein
MCCLTTSVEPKHGVCLVLTHDPIGAGAFALVAKRKANY